MIATRPAGLDEREAARLLAEHGPNTLPVAARRPGWRRLADQLTHFFAVLLWVAAVLAVVAGMPTLGAAIAAVVAVNGVFAFVQERGAERAADQLRALLPRRATVRRGGQTVEIDAIGLVPGDVVLLGAGDAVSADATLTAAAALRVDTSTLTGESVPVDLDAGDAVLAGTFVVEGDAVAVVHATGPATRLAGIARLTRAGELHATPLARQLQQLVRTIARIAVGTGVGFFALALVIGTPAADGFLFAVGVTVALVPEGLLPTVTVSLALGARRMAERNALVRRLESVATLGSTTFVCTDKTGTLTRNQMAVVAAWMPTGILTLDGAGYDPTVAAIDGTPDARAALTRLAVAGRVCSTGRAVRRDGTWQARGDPMEVALDVLARRLGADESGDPVVEVRFPFDPHRRRMSVVAGDEIVVKGAPDAVLPRCRTAAGSGDTGQGPDGAARGALEAFAARGLRTLAVAVRRRDEHTPADADAAEADLDLLGIVALEDPPRPQAADAIAACRRAGIRVAMLTGDHPATARAVATEVGLLRPDAPVLVGADLPADDQVLGALVDRDGVVVARVSPEDKLRIAAALRARGHVLAMTGDGVNDGPALQEADIGVAMGASGTDVARAAADLVLLDDDFATIVEAIVHGRAAFANLRRFLTYHLTDNVAELAPFVVWALSGGRFPLAIGVLQVLCLDIGTDLLPALALGAEAPAAHVLDRPPWHGRLLDTGVVLRAFGVLGPVEAFVELAAFVTGLALAGWRPGGPLPGAGAVAAASGAAFAAVVVGQMANAFACRSSTVVPWRLPGGPLANRLLGWAVLAESAALVGFVAIGPVASALGQDVPPVAAGAVALAAGPAVLAADATLKRRRRSARSAPAHRSAGTPPAGAASP